MGSICIIDMLSQMEPFGFVPILIVFFFKPHILSYASIVIKTNFRKNSEKMYTGLSFAKNIFEILFPFSSLLLDTVSSVDRQSRWFVFSTRKLKKKMKRTWCCRWAYIFHLIYITENKNPKVRALSFFSSFRKSKIIKGCLLIPSLN